MARSKQRNIQYKIIFPSSLFYCIIFYFFSFWRMRNTANVTSALLCVCAWVSVTSPGGTRKNKNRIKTKTKANRKIKKKAKWNSNWKKEWEKEKGEDSKRPASVYESASDRADSLFSSLSLPSILSDCISICISPCLSSRLSFFLSSLSISLFLRFFDFSPLFFVISLLILQSRVWYFFRGFSRFFRDFYPEKKKRKKKKKRVIGPPHLARALGPSSALPPISPYPGSHPLVARRGQHLPPVYVCECDCAVVCVWVLPRALPCPVPCPVPCPAPCLLPHWTRSSGVSSHTT